MVHLDWLTILVVVVLFGARREARLVGVGGTVSG